MVSHQACWLVIGLLIHGCLSDSLSKEAHKRLWDAWVRQYPCDGSSYWNIEPAVTPFWITSIRGKFAHLEGSTQLSISILAVTNTSLFDCNQLDLTTLRRSLGFQILGKPTGKIARFNRTCPLPITDDLTP